MKKIPFGLACVLLALLLAGPCIGAEQEARLVVLGGEMVQDTHSGLVWQLDRSRQKFKTADEAKLYASGLAVGGNRDWRLPTLEERWELLQVFVFKQNGEVNFPRFDSKYWTTDTEKGTVPLKLDITCMCRGDQEIEYKNNGYVRAVREMIAPLLMNTK